MEIPFRLQSDSMHYAFVISRQYLDRNGQEGLMIPCHSHLISITQQVQSGNLLSSVLLIPLT